MNLFPVKMVGIKPFLSSKQRGVLYNQIFSTGTGLDEGQSQ